MTTINEYTTHLCSILHIPVPQIVISQDLATTTALAQYHDGTITLTNTDMTPDTLFAIAHELRHAWQSKHALYMLDGYKQPNECEDKLEYNMQLAELDANAFGYVVMADMFGLDGKFESIPGYKEEVLKYVKDHY